MVFDSKAGRIDKDAMSDHRYNPETRPKWGMRVHFAALCRAELHTFSLSLSCFRQVIVDLGHLRRSKLE
jgi:hypothetical protein